MTQPIILVASGTANTGREVVKQLSATGKVSVRALTRNPDSETAKHLATLPRVTVVKGDFLDPASLKAALQGVSRAFLVSAAGDDKQYDRETAFIAAATEADVEVVVRISTTNCLISVNATTVFNRAHARIEKYIEAHHSKVVDLQPGFFMSNLLMSAGEAKATGKVTYPMTNEEAANMAPISIIDPRDIAGAAVAVLLSPKEQLTTLLDAGHLEVHGPEPATFAQYLAAVSKVIGKPLSFNYLPPDDFTKMLQSFGVSQELSEGVTDSYLIGAGKKETLRPRNTKTSPALAAIWQPKITIDQWAKEVGPAFA